MQHFPAILPISHSPFSFSCDVVRYKATFPISDAHLGSMALSGRAFAKALRYKETEFMKFFKTSAIYSGTVWHYQRERPWQERGEERERGVEGNNDV